MDALMLALELLCYSGNFLSGMIARNILRMKQKTLINKMFLGYFSIDCVIGFINPFFLFKLYQERLENTNFGICCLKFLGERLLPLSAVTKLSSPNPSPKSKSQIQSLEERDKDWG